MYGCGGRRGGGERPATGWRGRGGAGGMGQATFGCVVDRRITGQAGRGLEPAKGHRYESAVRRTGCLRESLLGEPVLGRIGPRLCGEHRTEEEVGPPRRSRPPRCARYRRPPRPRRRRSRQEPRRRRALFGEGNAAVARPSSRKHRTHPGRPFGLRASREILRPGPEIVPSRAGPGLCWSSTRPPCSLPPAPETDRPGAREGCRSTSRGSSRSCSRWEDHRANLIGQKPSKASPRCGAAPRTKSPSS